MTSLILAYFTSVWCVQYRNMGNSAMFKEGKDVQLSGWCQWFREIRHLETLPKISATDYHVILSVI